MKNEENKKLIERFPFLIPRNRWTDEIHKDYDYSVTELDFMPDGWRIAFGEQMCQEIMDELIVNDWVDKYRIFDIKEKFGHLCWYDNYGSDKIHKEIIPKYVDLSTKTCIKCGRPAKWMTTWWISPYCDECKKEIESKNIEHFVTLEEWERDITEEDSEE